MAQTIAITRPLTCIDVQRRLEAAHARMGNAGRFALTWNIGNVSDFYVTHWHRPEPHAFEDCRAVASGELADVLDAVDRYAATFTGTPVPVPAIAAE